VHGFPRQAVHATNQCYLLFLVALTALGPDHGRQLLATLVLVNPPFLQFQINRFGAPILFFLFQVHRVDVFVRRYHMHVGQSRHVWLARFCPREEYAEVLVRMIGAHDWCLERFSPFC
jgi:hypothetical protein